MLPPQPHGYYPSRQAPLPPQQSVEAQQLPLLSPPEEVGGDAHEEVVVSENRGVEIGSVMARDGEKRMMGSMQMDKHTSMFDHPRTRVLDAWLAHSRKQKSRNPGSHRAGRREEVDTI